METNGLIPDSEIFPTEDIESAEEGGRMKRILTATARESRTLRNVCELRR